MSITINVESDETIVIKLSENPIRMDADSVSGLISRLAELRREMKPRIGTSLKLETKTFYFEDPGWKLEGDAFGSFALFHVRDPGYGWTHYALSRDCACSLASALKKQIEGHLSDKSKTLTKN